MIVALLILFLTSVEGQGNMSGRRRSEPHRGNVNGIDMHGLYDGHGGGLEYRSGGRGRAEDIVIDHIGESRPAFGSTRGLANRIAGGGGPGEVGGSGGLEYMFEGGGRDGGRSPGSRLAGESYYTGPGESGWKRHPYDSSNGGGYENVGRDMVGYYDAHRSRGVDRYENNRDRVSSDRHDYIELGGGRRENDYVDIGSSVYDYGRDSHGSRDIGGERYDFRDGREGRHFYLESDYGGRERFDYRREPFTRRGYGRYDPYSYRGDDSRSRARDYTTDYIEGDYLSRYEDNGRKRGLPRYDRDGSLNHNPYRRDDDGRDDEYMFQSRRGNIGFEFADEDRKSDMLSLSPPPPPPPPPRRQPRPIRRRPRHPSKKPRRTRRKFRPSKEYKYMPRPPTKYRQKHRRKYRPRRPYKPKYRPRRPYKPKYRPRPPTKYRPRPPYKQKYRPRKKYKYMPRPPTKYRQKHPRKYRPRRPYKPKYRPRRPYKPKYRPRPPTKYRPRPPYKPKYRPRPPYKPKYRPRLQRKYRPRPTYKPKYRPKHSYKPKYRPRRPRKYRQRPARKFQMRPTKKYRPMPPKKYQDF